MNKQQAIDHFGTQAALAKALGVTRGAVWQWPDVIPELSARRLQEITNGKLRFDETLYRQAG